MYSHLKKAVIDKISGWFLENGENIFLTKTIAEIRNSFISSGLFQSDCKIAKSKSLYKKGFKTNPENVRPISLLPLILKVIEKRSGRSFFASK